MDKVIMEVLMQQAKELRLRTIPKMKKNCVIFLAQYMGM
jgi:hypothetical protein